MTAQVSPNMPLNERLELYSERITESGCQIWIISTNQAGYGRLKIKGKMIQAHRLAYELKNGEIPDGLCVLHRCDTPSCINPDHLFLGTRKDNMDDHMRKGRYPAHHAEDGHNTKLIWADIKIIRRRADEGEKYVDISMDYNVTPETISDIARERTWEKKYEPK